MIAIDHTIFFFAAALISVFRLDGLIYLVPAMKYVYGAAQAAVLAWAVYLMMRERMKVNALLIFMGLYFGFNLAVTVFQEGSLEQMVSMVTSDFAICLAGYIGMKLDHEKFIVTAEYIFRGMLLLNLTSMLAFPGGLGLTRSSNKIFLLASDNGLLKYLLVFCVVHGLYGCLRGSGLFTNLWFYGVCITELLIGDAATSYVAFAAYLAGLLFLGIVPYTRLIWLLFGSILAANWFLLIFRRMELFSAIVALVGKNITFSGRTLIWDSALRLLERLPVFGYGVSENTYYVVYKNTPMEAHNMILSLLLQGGILLLALFAAQIVCVNLRVQRLGAKSALNCAVLGIASYGVMFLVESPPIIPGFFLTLILGALFPGDISCRAPERKRRWRIYV